MKKIFVTLLLVVLAVSAIFADGLWYDGLKLKKYEINGLKNIEASKIYDVMNPYVDEVFTKDLYSKIQNDLYKIEGIDYVSANIVDNVSPSGVKLIITVNELPMISSINYVGNNKVKSYELTDSLNSIKVGTFFDSSKKSQVDLAVNDLKTVYLSKGFEDTPIELSCELDSSNNKVALTFNITEGEQSRIVAFYFKGNNNVADSAIKKLLSSKTKSLFNNGYLDYAKISTDAQSIISYYSTLGYIDALVSDIKYEEVSDLSNDKYKAIAVTFEIEEGKQWYFGGLSYTGNTVYSTDKFNSLVKSKVGSVVNLVDLQTDLTSISDVYYDNGYISCQMSIDESRDSNTNTISYVVSLIEGTQSYIEAVNINGLTKTKEYVMTRELELKEGDVFSKTKLLTSAQNIYNTGLLKDLDYNINYGSTDNSVIVDFDVEEGNQMDIQFGATFGGTVDGFPISGFLQWADHNFRGRGQEFSIATNISPDSQTLSFSFGDDWVKNHRWSNTFSFDFSHTKYTDEYQKATGSLEDAPFYNGRNDDVASIKGTSSKDLMDYDQFTLALSYQSGYTFIYDVGRLSLSGGLSISLNRALFDDCYVPYELLIHKYGENWQFSNRLAATITWDGRDYIQSPTKGYVLSTSATYAGGILGGLSNYIKLNSSAAAYFKVAEFGDEESDKKNLMFCASTNASIMLKQYYNYENEGWAFKDPRLGATKYEMLYIDGMTTARGHDADIDNVFMWDNMFELSYPLVENVLQGEAFVSGTALLDNYDKFKSGLDWYLSAGAGIKLKISGFPLGFYIVKNATYNKTNNFKFLPGSVFHNDNNANSGMKFVLAISTSLI